MRSWQCDMERVTRGKCPMCQEPDSAGHILGGCLHQYPEGMIIKRHNEAVCELHKSIMLLID